MGHAGGPAGGCPFLRRDTGDAHAFALGQLLGAVTGQAHRGEQGVAQALRTTGIGALAVEHVDPILRVVLADRMRDLVAHAFDRPEGPPPPDPPKLTPRRAVVRPLPPTAPAAL